MRPRTCAVCIGDIVGQTRYEPIGRDDAMVAVCSRCALEEIPDPGEFRRVYIGRKSRVLRIGGGE